MKSTIDLISQLRQLNIQLWLEEGRLRYRAPKDILTPELLAEIKEHKHEIIDLIQISFSQSIHKRTDNHARSPTSFVQQRFWFLDQLETNNASNNIIYAYQIEGMLNVLALQKALEQIIERHEILRTRFELEEDKPVQITESQANYQCFNVNLPQSQERIWELIQQEAQRPFNLALGPLLRVNLYQLSEQSYILLIVIHHIVFDGWSKDVFFKELADLYQEEVSGQSVSLPALPIQYADFAIWQKQWLEGERTKSAIEYWKKQLAGIPDCLRLPIDNPHPDQKKYKGRKHAFILDKEITDPIRSLSKEKGVTLFMILLSAWSVLLYRYSGQPDLVIGTPIANRNLQEIENLIGCFINTLPLRITIEDSKSFEQLLEEVKTTALEAYDYQDFPFEKIVEVLQPERNLSNTPLFQVMFVLQHTPNNKIEIQGLKLTPLDIDNGTAKFDLTLSITETPTELKGCFEYNVDIFTANKIEAMVGHFQTLLKEILNDTTQEIGKLTLLTQAERHQLLVEWNDTKVDYPAGKSIYQLFEEQVEKTPEAIALVFQEQELTYQQLNNRANRLAHYLISLGVKPETLVGICIERSFEMIVGLLGILKAGGAYVPLDPSYPLERLNYMLEDSAVDILVTQEKLLESLPPNAAKLVFLDRDWETINQSSANNPVTSVSSDNLAYVIYTSGSTGKPKGVLVLQKGVVRLVKKTNYVDLTVDEVLLQLAPISFDASTWEIWGSLLNGAKLVIYPNEAISLQTLGNVLKRYKVTTLWLTSGLFNLIVDEKLEDLKGMKKLLAGGDVLSIFHVQKVLSELKDCQLINGYGPTENTTFSCCYSVKKDYQLVNSVPIGKPINNTQVYILDSHLQPVPIGVAGELHVGGDGLARGYLNNPELTAEKFIDNPFGDGRLYKTGDLACYLPDGNIEYLGRIDNQVKIRGFRIELGEIETVLNSHPQIQQAIVIAREDEPGNKQLVAYLITNEETIDSRELQNFLKGTLPEFMMPSLFVSLDSLPLTPNGKVDRRALPVPKRTKHRTKENAAPRTPNEVFIAKIWAEILNLENIGIYDNFFELGGHSLMVPKLFLRIANSININLPLSTIFYAPTVEEMAKIIAQTEENKAFYSSLVPLQTRGNKPPLFLIHACNGETFIYRTLAQKLGPEIPVYGLQAVGLDEKQEPHQSVEAMASHYLKELITIQPNGPYFLGGKHIGALIALEIAQRLVAQDQQVDLVITIGGLMRQPHRLSHKWFTRQLKIIKTNDFYHFKKRLSQIINHKILRRFSSINDQNNLIENKSTKMNRSLSLAYDNYIPQPYKGRMIALEPTVDYDKLASKVLYFKSLQDAQRNYEELEPKVLLNFMEIFSNGFELNYVPGNDGIDYTAYKEPHVQVMAERIKVAIDNTIESEIILEKIPSMLAQM